ncbi:heavy metal transporter [Solimonas fluminis]|uniref:Heavy metal transporter n=1 Tax=Solimonas fluminis TaxID=2086571 RepID=A0A2S5TEQ2_9GAMM|nr:heavy-metal-associated domain-containing protein [Solimonas fluminis]PPE73473.1 heavy metal transporter [Solimonas fluminis]
MYQFHVPTMTCGHCVARVTRAVQSADPRARVQIDLAGKTLSVESTASDASLRQALSEAGYPAR